MRTTLTIDDDIAVLLNRRQEATGASFKHVVNEALRQGLKEVSRPPRRRRFKTGSFDAGRCLIGNVDNIGEALAIAEGEDYR